MGAQTHALPSVRSRSEGARPASPTPDPAPQPQPYLDVRHFRPHDSLRPGHGAATATLPSPTGEGGESKGGKEEKAAGWPQT